jgi:hypothetical protein
MKIAKIVPLFFGDRKEFSNYIPVSILLQQTSIICKNNNIMYKGRYGFTESHSTELALMELIEYITINLDNKLVTTGVLFI